MSRTSVLLVLTLFSLAACGGGGGSGGGAEEGTSETYTVVTDPPLQSPPDPIPSPGPGFSWRHLAGGIESGVTSAREQVVRTEADWITLWSEHYVVMPLGPGLWVPPPPAIDWANEIVVAILLGGRPTGGFTVSVTDVVPEGTGFHVSYLETQPGPNCVVSQAFTQPCVMIALTRVEGPGTFTKSTSRNTCP